MRPDRFLERADGKDLLDGTARQLLLERAVGRAEQRTGVAFPERVVLDEFLDRRRQLEQPEGVRDRHAAAPHARRDLLVRELEVLDELLVRGRFLERVEV